MEIVQALLQGQRGRRLLWEFAVAGEAQLVPDYSGRQLSVGMFYASYQAEAARGEGVVMFGPGAEEAKNTFVSAQELAGLLERAELVPVTAELMHYALHISVDAARYWQEADGTDTVLASDELKAPLERIAKHVQESGQVDQWFDAVILHEQHHVKFEITDPVDPIEDTARTGIKSLLAWKEHVILTEVRDTRDNRSRALGTCSGEWWSSPNFYLEPTCGQFASGEPVGLSCVEDAFSWEKATTTLVDIPTRANVLEISSAEQWVQLCKDHPIEVTAQKRHDWYHVTGRDGAWLMPDWLAVARRYDGVHLSIGAYLALAGHCLTVDAKFATLIAGWDPGKTYWFIDTVADRGYSQTWKFIDADSEEQRWVRAENSLG